MKTCNLNAGAERCSADRGYALLRDGQLLRFSFSRSLLDYLARKVPGTQVAPATLRTGLALKPNDGSSTGLYAVCKAETGWPLRVTLFRELAEHWRHPTRDVRECWINLNQAGAETEKDIVRMTT